MFLGKVQEVLECGENPLINYNLFMFHNVVIINSQMQGGDASSPNTQYYCFVLTGLLLY